MSALTLTVLVVYVVVAAIALAALIAVMAWTARDDARHGDPWSRGLYASMVVFAAVLALAWPLIVLALVVGA